MSTVGTAQNMKIWLKCTNYYTFGLNVQHMGLEARKPVFGVSEMVIPKSACSATETTCT